MKKFLLIILLGVDIYGLYANNDELIYSTQCAYDRLVKNAVIQKEDYIRVVKTIIDTVDILKKAENTKTSADYCNSYSVENSFEDNCALFLSELCELLEGDVSNRNEAITSEVKLGLINEARRTLDSESLRMLGISK